MDKMKISTKVNASTWGATPLKRLENSPDLKIEEWVFNYGEASHSWSFVFMTKWVGKLFSTDSGGHCHLELTRIWPSSLDYCLADSFFKHCGIALSEITDGTVLEYNRNEEQILASLIHLSMLSGWEISLKAINSELEFFLTHDFEFGFRIKEENFSIIERFNEEVGAILQKNVT